MMRPLLLALILCAPLAADNAVWLSDLDAAQKAARAGGKAILVNVTGSDWCPPCLQMEAEIFGRPDFAAAAAGYVLLKLDYPRALAQPERLRAQNKTLAERYPFEGFPTTLVLDATGLLIGQQSGYVAGGVAGYLKLADRLAAQKVPLQRLRDAVAAAAAGAARAQAQDALFRQAEAWNLTSQYADLPLKIVAEDKDGKAGLKARYQTYNAWQRIVATWAQRDDFSASVTDLGRLADNATAWPDLRQKILFTRGMIQWNGLDDEKGAADSLRTARNLAPDSPTGQRADELLDQLP